MATSSESFYRQTAAEGATYIGLLIVVYDTLAGDLRRAGLAVKQNDIAVRCNASNHALLLLGHLESWAAALEEHSLADSLSRFYSHLRSQLLSLQSHAEPEALFALAELVEQTRATWQTKEIQLMRATQLTNDHAKATPESENQSTLHQRVSWSA